MADKKFDKQFFMRRLERMRENRSSFASQWQELGDYILPQRYRKSGQQPNDGKKKRSKIIDATTTYAARTLSAGMLGGFTSPSRRWFNLSSYNPGLSEAGDVKEFLYACTQRMNTVFTKSNLYNALSVLYGDMSTFGTGAVLVLEHPHNIIQCISLPVGSYMLALDQWQMPNAIGREMTMTVEQLVEKFGIDNVSGSVKESYNQSDYDRTVDVAHIIMPRVEGMPKSDFDKPYVSVYLEKGGDNKFLNLGGFDEFPALIPRWEVGGDDIYGTSCPGMIALGDTKSLQHMHKRMAQAIDKQVNPPLMGPNSLRNTKVSLLPGDVTYVDQANDRGGLKPVHEVMPRVQELGAQINQYQQSISRAYYVDLFLMLAQDDRQRTATEVSIIRQEQMTVLTPVLERLNAELLNPLINRTFNIMARRGLLPPVPQSLQGQPLKVEYISILSQAQKATATTGVEQLASFAGNLSAVEPNVIDNIDMDKAVFDYADMVGVPPDMIRDKEDVQAIRAQRAQAQMAQQKAELAQQMAQGAKTLSETDMGGNNALTQLMGGAA